jgi:hypothetical protein
VRGRIAILIVLAAALAAPADALAVDHVWLSLNATGLGDGWRLTGASVSGDFYPGGREVLGVTLTKRRSASAHERHALRASLTKPTVSFDGRSGRWQARRVNGAFDVSMAIAKSGEPQEVSEALGCRGTLSRVPVTLTGTFVLRTGTAALRTIRRARLTGTITYNQGLPVECGLAPTGCEADAWLSASSGQNRLLVNPARRVLTLSFPEAGGWYHVLEREQVQVTGGLPTIRVAAAGLGSVTFAAGETTETVSGPCRVATTEGALSGSLAVRFAVWGARTFRGTTAQYRQYSPA